MLGERALAPQVVARVRGEQIVMLYAQWRRATWSMGLGALLLYGALGPHVAESTVAWWAMAIAANQTWRWWLARARQRAAPPVGSARRWGWYWAAGSWIAGALWGVAAAAMFPAAEAHQALLIVGIFAVVLGGLNLTALYKPSFYGFVLLTLVPLIVRVAMEGDEVHLFTALVLTIVLGFVLAFGHRLNDLLVEALAMRYENIDLIAELKQQGAAAERARAAAEAANCAKSRFLAAASHDLRQPLHALGLFAAALAAQPCAPSLRRSIENVCNSVEALDGLVEQLLDLSRLDAGAVRVTPTVVPLQPMFAKLNADFAPLAAAADLRLRFVPTRLAVASDGGLLERIVRNLVANALSYTVKGGVVVGARRCGEWVRVDVVDTGVGVAAADHARIFDEFVRLDDSTLPTLGGRGLGLGLAIVRGLAQRLDHPLALASVPGRGSRFTIRMRRVVTPGAVAIVAAVAAPPTLDESARAARHCAPLGPCALTGVGVLVIDDDPAVVAAMRALLGTWGARVHAGASLTAAWNDVDASRVSARPDIDLVVADLRLGRGMSGLGVVETVRRTLAREVPAILVSGDTSDAARVEAACAGITLLPKPVLADRLYTTVIAALDTLCDHPPRARGAKECPFTKI